MQVFEQRLLDCEAFIEEITKEFDDEMAARGSRASNSRASTATSDLNISREGFRWFRPGGGLFHRRMLITLQKHNYQLVLGNVFPFDANDWRRLQSAWPAVNAWHLSTRMRAGAIAIVHDREWTVEALRVALPRVAKHLEVTTLTHMYNRFGLWD